MSEMTVQQALLNGVEAHKKGHLDKAEIFYEAILKVMPTHADANHNLGILNFGNGEFNKALEFFECAIESNATQPQFWLSKLEVLIRLDRLEDALAVYDEVKDKGFADDVFEKVFKKISRISNKESDESVLSVIKKSEILKETGQIDEAITILSSSIETNQDNIKLIGHLITCYILGNYLELAKNLIDKVKQLDLESSVIGWSEARLKLKENKKSDALEIALKTYKMHPNDADGAALLGACYLANNNLEASIKFSKLATEIDPRVFNAWVNLGISSLRSNNLKDAQSYFETAYEINSSSLKVLKLLGKIYLDLLEYARALGIFEKLVGLEPQNSVYLMNLAVCYQKLGQLDDAILNYIKVTEIDPAFADVYVNLGNCYRLKGDLEKSYTTLKHAISLKPNFYEAENNLGITLMKQGKFFEALQSFILTLEFKSDFSNAFYNLALALKKVEFDKSDRRLLVLIEKMLNAGKDYFRPNDISKSVISLLKWEPTLSKYLTKSSSEIKELSIESTLNDMANTPVLFRLMSVCVMNDLQLEGLFKRLRASLLFSNSSLVKSEAVLEFQSVLAMQCFINEYIYGQSDIESTALKLLEDTVCDALSRGENPRAQDILCLASYKALCDYQWIDQVEISNLIKAVYTQQVIEPYRESQIKAEIPVFALSSDKVSEMVKVQYEENPYPRWVCLEAPPQTRSVSEFVSDFQLRLIHPQVKKYTSPSILVAGCGTGQHSITTARRFKSSKVTAIDLSFSSLAYAKRKTQEYGIDNINYLQGDILDLPKMNERFDIVESVGVLHHMRDPITGWRVLANCLKPHGLMRIGLYSKLARKHIVKMREEIVNLEIKSTYDAMIDFRNKLILSEKDHHKKIIESPDFYSLSNFRDLIFHVQEHRFTILEIKDILSDLGLVFCGFEHDVLLDHFRLSYKEPNDLYNLDKWHDFESVNDRVFRGLYLFWCQKQ